MDSQPDQRAGTGLNPDGPTRVGWGACPRLSACARMVQEQHVWFSTRRPRSITGCGRHPSIAQKQSNRLITDRPGSVTLWRDHFDRLFS